MRIGDVLDAQIEQLATRVVDAIYTVHSTLGPGLLESVYENCLSIELTARGLKFKRQVYIPIIYREQSIEPGLRLDLLVEDRIIIEIKSVEAMHPVFHTQLITYLKLSHLQLGFLVNFNVPLIKDGIKRIIYTPPVGQKKEKEKGIQV